MPIIPLKCPACGADLQADSDSPILTCQYCGTSSVMKDAIVQNYIQNTVNITAGTVNVVNLKDFVIEAGVLKKYQGESVNVDIPNNVFAIGKKAFFRLKIKAVTIPDSVTEIDEDAFSLCSALTSITIPDSVTSIGSYAFNGCSSLMSITIPDSVTEIDDSAFSGCSALTSITIPDSVTTIDRNAFDCSPLSTVKASENTISKLLRTCDLRETPFATHQREYWRSRGQCRNCGGDFKGLFNPVCAKCGRRRDY